jgi:hypothetical protein
MVLFVQLCVHKLNNIYNDDKGAREDGENNIIKSKEPRPATRYHGAYTNLSPIFQPRDGGVVLHHRELV